MLPTETTPPRCRVNENFCFWIFVFAGCFCSTMASFGVICFDFSNRDDTATVSCQCKLFLLNFCLWSGCCALSKQKLLFWLCWFWCFQHKRHRHGVGSMKTIAFEFLSLPVAFVLPWQVLILFVLIFPTETTPPRCRVNVNSFFWFFVFGPVALHCQGKSFCFGFVGFDASNRDDTATVSGQWNYCFWLFIIPGAFIGPGFQLEPCIFDSLYICKNQPLWRRYTQTSCVPQTCSGKKLKCILSVFFWCGDRGDCWFIRSLLAFFKVWKLMDKSFVVNQNDKITRIQWQCSTYILVFEFGQSLPTSFNAKTLAMPIGARSWSFWQIWRFQLYVFATCLHGRGGRRERTIRHTKNKRKDLQVFDFNLVHFSDSTCPWFLASAMQTPKYIFQRYGQ